MALKLTQGERIMIGRRRDGYTQGAYAKKLKTTQTMVSRWESGRLPPPDKVTSRYRKLGRLTQGEQIMVYRRRTGLSIREAAKMYDISHFHLIRLENDERRDDGYTAFIRDQYEAAA